MEVTLAKYTNLSPKAFMEATLAKYTNSATKAFDGSHTGKIHKFRRQFCRGYFISLKCYGLLFYVLSIFKYSICTNLVRGRPFDSRVLGTVFFIPKITCLLNSCFLICNKNNVALKGPGLKTMKKII